MWIARLCLLDDLDEKLFAVELSNCQVEKQQQPAVSGSKRRPWHWKHTLPNTVDKKDPGMGKAQSSSSLEGSRRGSVCSSSQSSPIKSSPKRSKDQQLKKAALDDGSPKNKKDINVKCDSTFSDDRLTAVNAHLYSVLEEQALGEIIRESVDSVYTEGNNRVDR